MNKKMIILSLDAVGSRDMEFMESLPNFGGIVRKGAICRNVTSVYPSLTYPAHTSIVTGKYPANHGIINNVKFQPGRLKPDWFWQRESIIGSTLYDEAAKQGKQVAALLWPVTGKAGSIAYNLPEVLPNRPWQNQMMVSFLNGSPLYELELQRKFGSLRKGISQPYLDDFVQASMIYTLKKHKPDLMLVHMTDVDTMRHNFGVDSFEAEQALRRHDMRIGELLNTIRDLGWMESMNIVILGDHCQMDTHTVLYPNWLFKQHGHITVKNGTIASWNILARDCDGSCYIYVKDKKFYREAALLLKSMCREWDGIAHIATGIQAKAQGADGRCAFMLEAKEGYYFQNGWEIEREQTGPGMFMEKPHLQAATHGYHPDIKGYGTFFVGAGVDFRPKAVVEQMSLVDEGPTIADILGIKLADSDGRCIKELLHLK